MLEYIHRDVVRLMMRVSPLQAQTWYPHQKFMQKLKV
jgi:hypothetical protein